MIAVLFARKDSIYKTLPACDVYDADRDARTFRGGRPVVAHPPCRSWGRLHRFANPAPGERDNARWAVQQVRRWGGVLEHPAGSMLWADQGMAMPGRADRWGFTLPVSQWWWGHKAEKPTWLYICGLPWDLVPEIPFKIGTPDYVVARNSTAPYRGTHKRPEISKADRERTPVELARWLVRVAGMCLPEAQEAAS